MNQAKIIKLLKKNNFNFIHINNTSSTMDYSKNYLKNNFKNIVVITDEQTKGRGQHGNTWISSYGNIYLSIVIKNKIPIQDHFIFSMISLVSIQKTLIDLGVNNIIFKWPNDIFFKDRKLGGIILENHTLSNNECYMIIGIGINFLSSPIVDKYKTTFVNNFVKISNKFIFLEKFLINFFYFWNNLLTEKNNIISKFKNSLMFVNKKIKIKINEKKIITGILKGINNDGSILLEKKNKKISIYSGSILL